MERGETRDQESSALLFKKGEPHTHTHTHTQNQHQGQRTKYINIRQAFSSPEQRQATNLEVSVLAASVIHGGRKGYVEWSLGRCPALAFSETREQIPSMPLKGRDPA